MIEIKRTAGICPVCKKKNHPLAPDNREGSICEECQEKLAKENAFIICGRCHRIAAVIKSGKTPEDFIFEAGKFYTADGCVKCSPFVSELKVVELEEYKKKGVKND